MGTRGRCAASRRGDRKSQGGRVHRPDGSAGMSGHIPVMLDEVLATLAPRDGGIYLDGTFGGGGYARAILEQANCTLWAIDRDPDAIERGASMVARFPGQLHLLHGQFGDMVGLLNH